MGVGQREGKSKRGVGPAALRRHRSLREEGRDERRWKEGEGIP